MGSADAFAGARGDLDRWVVLLAGATLALALVFGLRSTSSGRAPRVASAARAHAYERQGLLSLPASARGPVSASLGADERAFFATRGSDGVLRVQNPAQRLTGTFTPAGVKVSSPSARVGLRLQAIGYGSALSPLGPTAPAARANRVLYARSGVSEWYANGPLGLEQGFTVARAPGASGAGPLTLAIGLSPGARATLSADGGAVTFGHGAHALRYGQLSAVDAGGRRLRAWMALDGGRLLLRVATRGARFPLRIDPLIQQGAPLRTGGELGLSVALSADGDTALVGGGGGGGAVVFIRTGSTWSQQATLAGSEQVGNAQFGDQVALSGDGDTALVSGSGDREGVGAVWVFTRSGTTWTQQGPKLTGGGEVGKGGFGDSVAISRDGDTALIGAVFDDGEAGAAWVFVRSGETWAQQGEKLTGPGEVGKGRLGEVALSADGDTAILDENRLSEPLAWVFVRSGETWTQQGAALPGGVDVALSADGNTALFGNESSASVYTRTGETWSAGPKLVPYGVDSEPFGAGVAISGDGQTALVSDEVDTGGLGAAWVFERAGESWTQQDEKLTPAVGGGGSYFGRVALSEDAGTALIAGGGRAPAVVFANVAYAPSAGPPEFGLCLPASPSQWSNSGCSTASGGGPGAGTHEWFHDTRRAPFTLQGGKGPTLGPIAAGASVACHGHLANGEIDGYNTVTGVVLRLQGCELGGQACTSPGSAAGELTTTAMEGALGVVKTSSAGAAKNTIGLDLFAPGRSGTLLEFSCATTTVVVRGGVIATVKANKMGQPKLKFSAKATGKQKPEGFEGGPREVLEASVDGAPYAQVGLTIADTLVPAEGQVEVGSAA